MLNISSEALTPTSSMPYEYPPQEYANPLYSASGRAVPFGKVITVATGVFPYAVHPQNVEARNGSQLTAPLW